MHKQKLLEELKSQVKKQAEPTQQKKDSSNLGNQYMLSQLGSGSAMPAPLQSRMEESLHADFSGVQLYESPLISDNGAQAVASGNRIAFAPGQLDFNSTAGVELLGHELSHVASQARGEVTGSGFVNDSALEHKADMEGAQAARDVSSGADMGTLSPMSASGPAASYSAPMQAKKDEDAQPKSSKKRKKHLSPLSKKRRNNMNDMLNYNLGYYANIGREDEGDDAETAANNQAEFWVDNMMEYSAYSAGSEGKHDLAEEKLATRLMQLYATDNYWVKKLLPVILKRQDQFAKKLVQAKDQLVEQYGEDEGYTRAKYSDEAQRMGYVNFMLQEFVDAGSMRKNEEKKAYMGQLKNKQKEEDYETFATTKEAQDNIVAYNEFDTPTRKKWANQMAENGMTNVENLNAEQIKKYNKWHSKYRRPWMRKKHRRRTELFGMKI